MSGAATCWEEVYRAQTARIAELDAENAALRSKLDDPARLHAHCVRHLTDAQVAHLFGERMTEIQNSRDRLEAENAALNTRIEELDAKWRMAEAQCFDQVGKIGEQRAELAALRADKARLDWLTNSLGWIVVGWPEADPSQHATEDGTLADAWRAAIDAAKKEAQP